MTTTITTVFALAFFSLVSLNTLASNKTLKSVKTPSSNTNISALLQQIEQIRLQYNIPAIGITLVKNAEVEWQGSLGVVDRRSNQPANENTFYRVGSITKTFTALAILKLQEQGKLTLGDNLSTYASADRFQNPWSEEYPITIEQLLEHTAGFSDIGTAEFNHEDPVPISLDDALAFNSEHHKVQWRPGLHSSYSNLGSGFVGAVIEKVSGQSYDTFLVNTVLKPLNMPQSSTLLTPVVDSLLAKGHERGGRNESDYWHIIFRPFGALNSSPKEIASLLKVLVNRGIIDGKRFLSEASIERMESPQTTLAAQAGLKFGYGLGNYQTEHNGFIFHGHGGTAAGYLARFGYLLDNRSGYAVMINSNHSSAIAIINGLIRDYLIQDLTQISTPNDKPLQDDVTDYAGYYQPVTSRSRVAKFLIRFFNSKKLSIVQNELTSPSPSPFTATKVLTHQGHNFYREQGYLKADYALVKDRQGNRFLQSAGNYEKIPDSYFYAKLVLCVFVLSLTLFSIFYLGFLLVKSLVFRGLPEKAQWANLLRLSPFLLLFGLFFILITLPNGKGSFGAILFEIFGVTILLLACLNFILALLKPVCLRVRIQHLAVTCASVLMGIYLYQWDFISQPIWS